MPITTIFWCNLATHMNNLLSRGVASEVDILVVGAKQGRIDRLEFTAEQGLTIVEFKTHCGEAGASEPAIRQIEAYEKGLRRTLRLGASPKNSQVPLAHRATLSIANQRLSVCPRQLNIAHLNQHDAGRALLCDLPHVPAICVLRKKIKK